MKSQACLLSDTLFTKHLKLIDDKVTYSMVNLCHVSCFMEHINDFIFQYALQHIILLQMLFYLPVVHSHYLIVKEYFDMASSQVDWSLGVFSLYI